MLSFLFRRLLSTLPVLGVVAVLVFLMLRLTPGDPAAVLAREICDYYPASAVTSRADQFLKQHPQPKNKNP
jgi:ABC-type dipeptide/oligopeptide/nickel transport system permease component